MTECSKKGFRTKRIAKDFLKPRKHNNGLRARHVYECPQCGQWHLTSQTAGPRT